MERPRFFTKSKPEGSVETPSTPINWGKYFRRSGLILACAIVLAYLVYTVSMFGKTVIDRWPEISFAYNHPQFVKNIRTDWDNKQAALEQEFKTNTPDQALMQQVKQTVDQEVQAKQQTNPYSFR